ncbi:Esterase [Monoraphidium neglectum]|uniref:Esterase n=1 Tax=Monoraphidium neglectum TaxID=145388 RepID=A0A0D2KSW4_9CHLO|nr:Esterase [Monoraphidium neglectum]KIY98603.1 Esterase [Monoraphidium neglectum]|eukprot:XP_013897623.1 Esterase [Monoraphidium neglectum]
MFQRPIIGSLAVPAGGRVTRRKGLRRAAYATPLLTVAIASTLRVAAARLLGFRGAHDWPLREELFIVFLRALLEYGDIAVWRVFFQFVCPNPLKLPPGMRDAPAALAGSRSVWYELAPELLPAQPRGRVNMMFIHGGAFIAGFARQYQNTYVWWLKQLARRGIAAKILSVEYPLAPEHPYPAARDVVEAEILWLLEQSGDTPVIIGGDSAGGNLAVSGLAHLRDTGRLPRPPAGALLISPCVDATGTSIFSQRDDGGAGRYDYLPRDKLHEGLPFFYSHELLSPYVSPTRLESFEGLAQQEIMTISGEAELMAPDIRAFAKKVQAASDASLSSGSPGAFRATYLEEPGCVHSWPMLLFPRLRVKQEPMFQFIDRMSGAPQLPN